MERDRWSLIIQAVSNVAKLNQISHRMCVKERHEPCLDIVLAKTDLTVPSAFM